MAGKIIADTLEHSTAGSVTTDYVVNGSAKAWANGDGTGTVSLEDSFNVTSMTDTTTGDYTYTLTSAMSNSNYACPVGISAGEGFLNNDLSTTTARIKSFFIGGTQSDTDTVTCAVFGDLA